MPSDEDEQDKAMPDLPIGFPTFKLEHRSKKALFALSLDVAKFLGLRDSYAFFYRHPQVEKVWTTEAEREFLVEQGLMHPHIQKRQLAMVSIDQVYKAIGSQMFHKKAHFSSSSSDSLASYFQSIGYSAPDGQLAEQQNSALFLRKRPAELKGRKAAIFDRFADTMDELQSNKLIGAQEDELDMLEVGLSVARSDREIALQRKRCKEDSLKEGFVFVRNRVASSDPVKIVKDPESLFPLAIMRGQYQEG